MSIAKKSVKWLVALFVIFALILTASLAVSNVTRANATEPEAAAADTEIALSVLAKGSVTGEAYPDLLSSSSDRTVTVEYYFDIPAAIEEDVLTEMKFDVYMTLPDNSTVKPTNIEVNTAVASAVTMDALTNQAEEGYLDDAETAATEFGITLKTGHTMSELRGFTKSGTTYTLGNYFFKATYTVPASTDGAYSFGFGATSEVPANEALESEDAIIYVPEVTNVTTDTVMDGIDDVTAVSTGIFYVRSYIDVPVAVSGLIFNAQQQTAIVDKDGYAYVIGDLVNDIYPVFYHDQWPAGFSLVPETYMGGVEAQQSSGTFALNDKDIYIWRIPDGNDGYTYSTDNYTVNWEIAKRSITAPVSAGTTYTYNGQAQSFEFSEDPLTDAAYITITGTPQTDVGEYTVTAALTYPASTYWAGDATDVADKTYDFVINPALITVPTPADETYTYNGTAQSFQWASTPDALITITGTPQTNAGNYTITASIPANYAWNDEGHTTADKTFHFVIAKMQIAIPEEDDTVFVYTGSAQNYTVAASDYYTVTGTPQTNAGEYEVTISLDDTDNTEWSDGTTEDIVYDFVIAKVQITKPTPLDNVQYVYDSYNKQFMLDVVSAETGYYTISNNIRKNAGTQTVTVSLKDKTNTEWADGTTADLEFTFTVQRRPVNISVSADAASHVYGNTPANVSISMTGAIDAFSCSYKAVCVDGEAPYAEYTPTQFNEGLNAGHYTLNPVYNDINGNYDVTVSEPFSYEVIKREITIPTAISGLEYTGSAQVGVTKTDGSFYTLYSGSDEETAVGNYSATYRLNSTTNTYWAGDTTDVADKTVEWSIAKKSITKPSISASFKIYNGTSQSYSGSGTGYSFTGSGTNAGEYPVTVTLTDKANSVWAGTDSAEDYDEADKLVIAKKTVKLTLTESADSSVYGNSIATITAGIDPDYAPINTADIGTVSYTAKHFQTNVVYTKADFETIHTAPVGNYILTAVCSIDNPNYSVDAQTLPYQITKRQIEIPVVAQDSTSFTYSGSAQGISFFAGSLDGADYFTLSGTNSATNVGNYTYTATLNDATNCEWEDETTAAKNYDWSITTRYITVPTVVDDTFAYDGNEHSIGFSNVDNDYVDITYDTQSAIGVYTDTTTVALKAAHAGNIAWDDAGHTTAAKTYTLTIEVVEVNFTIVPIFNNTAKTGAAATQNVLSALPAATTYRWFKFTGYTFDDDAVSNVSLDMEGETVYANYTYAVGKGDVDGDGKISSADVILLKRWNVGLDRAKKIADAATAWAKTDDNSVTSAVLYTALDANNNGAIRSNDVVAVREALATGRTYKVLVKNGIVQVAKANRVTVSSYEDLLGNIRLGNPVTLGRDIDAANEIFNEDSLIPVDIDLGAHRLTVKGFTLNTATAGATLKIAGDAVEGGTLYTVTGITVTAPNGNVVVANVNGYSYDGTVVNLAAYSESLHIEDTVAFYIYKAQLPGTTTDYADVDAFIADVYPDEEEVVTEEVITNLNTTITTLANTRIGETDQRMQEIAAIKADTTKTESQKATEINAKDVKKAILEVPIDTHVVVEAAAKLSADKIVVKAQSDTSAPAVTTFAIEVKNAAAEVVTVDISEVKDNTGEETVYVVNEVAISGASSQVEVVAGENTAADVKKYVAQIGTTSYETLQAAINAAQNADTIKLIADVADGAGIAIPDAVSKTITIDFNGKTYTVVGPAVGSTGTESQSMHWSVGANVTLKNGTFAVAEGATGVTMGMQSHGVLTVNNMTIDMSKVPFGYYGTYTGTYEKYSNLEKPVFNANYHAGYTGGLTIINSTITLPADSTKGVYTELANTVITDSTINGSVALSSDSIIPDVTVTNSTITKGVVAYFAADMVAAKNGVWTIIPATIVTNEAELNAALADGVKRIILNADIEVTAPVVVDYEVLLDMNGKTIYNTTDIWSGNDWSLISVRTANGDLTITGDGTLSAKANDCYAIDVQDGATLDIEDGTYIGNVSAVYICHGGNVTINGGDFSLLQLYPDERYMLNCLDADYTAGTANFTVTGGTFHGFNPADNASEGAHTNYLANGYVAVEEDGVWTVIPATIVTNEAELKAAVAANAPYIVVGDDFSLASTIYVSGGKDIVIDMNGYSITSTNLTLFAVYAGNSLEFTGNGNLTLNNTAKPNRAAMWIEGSTNVASVRESYLTLGEGVTLTSTGYGLVLYEVTGTNYCYGVVISVDGTITTSRNAAICAIGNIGQHDGDVVNGEPIAAISEINIGSTASLTAMNSAIYAAGFAVWNIESGARLTGADAIYAKSGYLTIGDGVVLTATKDPATPYQYNGNGENPTGDGIVIDSCNYPGKAPVVNYTSALLDNITVTAEGAQKIATYWAVKSEAELNEAIAAKAPYIFIRDSFTVANQILIDYSLTINGNNKTITATGEGSGYAIYVMYEAADGVAVNIQDLTIISTGRQVAFMTNCDYASTATLTNVDITCDGECIYSNGKMTVTATGCNFTHDGIYAEGKDAVYYSALIVGYAGEIVAENCTVTSFGNGASTFPSGGTITLRNTDITISESASSNANAGYALWARNEDYTNLPGYNCDSVINVYSGTITGEFKLTDKYTGTNSKNVYDPIINIYGGTFDHDPTAYVADGYVATLNNDIWTVEAIADTEAVARIGKVAYATFDAAVAAAQDGDTIVLLADVTYGTDRVVPVWEIKAFNIDLNGKTFTTNSNQGITLSNNGYGASAICYGDNENTSPARNITVSNGTIRTAYGAGLYFDAAVTATLENLTVAQNYPENVQSTDEYSTAVRLTSGATVNIYSGTYSGKNAIAISNSGGYANIYGGDFRGVLFINGGASSTKVLTIYGGTFDHDPTAYVPAEGYSITEADGIYTVAALEGWTAVGGGEGPQGDPGLDD